MSEPTIDRLRRLAATPVSRWRSADLEWVPRPAGVEGHDAEVDSREFASWLADWTEAEAGQAVQDDGLDPEILAQAMAIWSDPDETDKAEIDRSAAFYVQSATETIEIYRRLRAAPPLHDPTPASESGQPPETGRTYGG